MLRKHEFFIEGEFYHLYNRGNDKRMIFNDEHDYRRFVALLYVCNGSNKVDITSHFQKGRSFLELFDVDRGERLVDIGAYCLMPNHFHILATPHRENDISIFMKKLGTAYSMYYNQRNQRSGTIFEGRYKSRHANNDNYLRYLFSYIHLNPVKLIDPQWKENGIADRAGAERFLKEYRYASYCDYLGEDRIESKILNRDVFPPYFESIKDFEQSVAEWLTERTDLS